MEGKSEAVCVIKRQAMKTNGEAEVRLHQLLTPALDQNEYSATRFGCFTPEEVVRCTNRIGGWMGLWIRT